MTARRLAYGIWVLTTVLSVPHIVLLVLGRHINAAPGFGTPGFTIVLALTFASMGTLIASRQSRNPIGWVFLGVGVMFSLQGLWLAYAIYGLLGPRRLPLAIIGAWLNSWIWIPGVASVTTVVLLVFPHGRLLSPRWRPWCVATIVFVGVVSVANALRVGPLENFGTTQNPFGVGGEVLKNAADGGFAFLNLATLLAAISVVIRYRRARISERAQIKWLAFAACLTAIVLPVSLAAGTGSAGSKIVDYMVIVSLDFIPIAIGIAVLRYRLYDIDRIISRTVSYGVVTALLAATFVVVALVPTTLAGRKTPGWLVALATLVVALLFQPIRRRVQSAVDLRFNRARYDASRTVESFASRLRDEIDLQTLQTELVGAVMRTVQPAQIGLWLYPRAAS